MPGSMSSGYAQLWRVVDGAVKDAFKNHPDYLTKSGRKFAQVSIVKRVTGTVLSFAVEQTARGQRELAVTGQGDFSTPASGPLAVHASTVTPAQARAVLFGKRRVSFARRRDAMTAQLRREVTERQLLDAVARAVKQ